MRSALPQAVALALSALPILAVAACGSSDDTTPASGTPSASSTPPASTTAPPAPVPLTWTPCPLHVEGGEPMAECTVAKVPLDRDAPDGETIDIALKRYLPKGGTPKRALWFLQGGPGGSGYVFEGIAEAYGTKYPDVEMYIPDHRGTGSSTKITCAANKPGTPGEEIITEDEWPACMDEVKATWGAKLQHFDTTNAANDLGVLIPRTKREGQPVFVLGISYGTYWAHRYLQLFPTQPDGVILDSIAPPGADLAEQDLDADAAVRDVLDHCAKNAFCKTKLGEGDQPKKKAEALVAKVKGSHCPGITPRAGFTRHEMFRISLGSMMMDPRFRNLVPSVVYRWDRCAPGDVDAINSLYAAYFPEEEQPLPEMIKQWGWVAGDNICFSEMWGNQSPTELAAIRDAAIASRDVTAGRGERKPTWPVYPKDAFVGAYAKTDVPLLMLQGGLDPATLLSKAQVMKDHFQGPYQHFVTFPEASHTTITSTATTAKRSCATMTLMKFIEDPKGPLDTSCMADIVPLQYETSDWALPLYGTADPWE